ncbi:protein NIM1-INTERACTING 3 isoform X1 [Manihot esculenta]|nr:protein NIM1-INTERACTING 3 isoform X1 [Manihot esculenta]
MALYRASNTILQLVSRLPLLSLYSTTFGMESDTRKRKIDNVEEQTKRKEERELEEDDEEKMEKFFSLIKSSIDLMRKGSSDSKEKQEKKTEAAAAWNPSFQPEDFEQDIVKDNQAAAGPSKVGEDEEEKQKKEGEKGDNGLDLNLSL